MQKYLLVMLFAGVHLVAHGQVIHGTVLDSQNGNAVGFAALYFNGTFVGTTSNEKGDFHMDISKYPSRPLTISAVGYYSSTLDNFSGDDPVVIYLDPKIYEIEEVQVSAGSLSRQRKAHLALFRYEFLGTTSNARACEILNEEDIAFYYGSDEDTLKAFASNPILIHNGALGYQITYYLDKFEYLNRSKTVHIRGDILFKDDLTTPQRYSERKRRLTYLGSRMHLLRSLWADHLEGSGFKLSSSPGTYLGYSDVVTEGDSLIKYMKSIENLYVYYYLSASQILFLKEEVHFEKDGFFDPNGIIWSGVMAKKRLGDWLPYEYTPGD